MEKGNAPAWKAVFFGVAATMGVYLLLLTITAYLTVSGWIGEKWMERAVQLCVCAAAFAGACSTSKLMQGKRGASEPLLGAATFCAVILLPAVFAGQEVTLYRAGSLLVFAAAGTLLSLTITQRKKGKRGRRRKTANIRR